jgi:hypothetical protein
MKSRMLRDASTGLLVSDHDETEQGVVMKNAELVEISLVVLENNYASRLNAMEPTNQPEAEVTETVTTV